MPSNGNTTAGNGMGDEYAGLLIDRLAATIIDDSLPLKDVERELRGCVAEVALKKRGLDKRETASRCGVTEKSIENYLKEARTNPKSPEREIARVLQDEMLTLEEIYEKARPVLSQAKNFTLDDAKRSLEKLIRTGEVEEYAGHKYRAVERPSIRYPATVEAHRELVDQKARDLDYIVLAQKEASPEDVERRTQRFSRVVHDTNLVRIDFTVNFPESALPEFYEKISAEIAKITMKHEKKKGASRLRLLLGMRSVTTLLALALLLFVPCWRSPVRGGELDQGATPNGEKLVASVPVDESWELDRQGQDDSQQQEGELRGIHGQEGPDDSGIVPRLEPSGNQQLASGSDPTPSRMMVGDVNRDRVINLTDVIDLVKYLHDEAADLPCMQAADTDGNGSLDMSDPLQLLWWLFGRPQSDVSIVLKAKKKAPGEQFDQGTCEASLAQ